MRKIVCLLFVAMLTHLAAWSQTRSVTGKISEANGNPVPFATVNVKGTKQTVAAGADGVFKIQAKTGDVLVISAVNFQTTEITVGEGPANAVLVQGTGTLTDVVVTTALGIQRQAKSLGYSTTKVTGKDILQSKPVSVVNGLTGKVAGLQINTVNNAVGAPTRITLRGNRSLLGNNQPLVIVDGAIFYNDISTLNPEDIVDVTTLKGSSAAALYGSDASNGVLVITTKRGTTSKPTINFTSTTQFETLAYLPKLQNRFGSN
ncbi:MAG TPA: TonB-dependent receptor plug domain-containing protein, partial [Chitinophagaceae bacterium]|nr:TonB-dependent receptor plug domain-containing protein [Chitinophagaceae bacterium]